MPITKVYDAAYPSATIPADGQAYLSYIDYSGNPNGFLQMGKLFPGKTFAISCHGDPSAPFQDCEIGAATPAQAVSAGRERRIRGQWTILYLGTTLPPGAIDNAMANANETFQSPESWPNPGIYPWSVNWNGLAEVPSGSVMQQYQGLGGWDISACNVDLFAHPNVQPVPSPIVRSTEMKFGEVPPYNEHQFPYNITGRSIEVTGETTFKLVSTDQANDPTHVQVLGRVGTDYVHLKSPDAAADAPGSEEYTIDNTQVLTLAIPEGCSLVWFRHRSATSFVGWSLS